MVRHHLLHACHSLLHFQLSLDERGHCSLDRLVDRRRPGLGWAADVGGRLWGLALARPGSGPRPFPSVLETYLAQAARLVGGMLVGATEPHRRRARAQELLLGEGRGEVRLDGRLHHAAALVVPPVEQPPHDPLPALRSGRRHPLARPRGGLEWAVEALEKELAEEWGIGDCCPSVRVVVVPPRARSSVPSSSTRRSRRPCPSSSVHRPRCP